MRFVILRHDPAASSGRTLHWDLMLEQEMALQTWALDEPPAAGTSVSATLLPDHRKAYLEYEGPISGNRGIVSRWDRGGLSWIEQTPERIVVRLSGDRCRGTMRLELSDSAAQRWTLSFSSDVTGAC